MNRSAYSIQVSGDPIQRISSVGELPAKYIRERTDNFSDSRLSAKLGSLSARQLVVLPAGISRVAVGPTEDEASLLHIPELQYTRHESRTAVTFGQLVIPQVQKEAIAELVAVKYTNTVLATRELSATLAVRNRIGADYAYDPIGFVSNEDRNKIGYISRYRHEVTTLDRIFWNSSSTDERRLIGAERAGSWFAMLHNHSLTHGDASAKNIAYDNAENPLFPDLETMRSLDGDSDEITHKQLDDVKDFIRYHDRKLSPQEFNAFETAYLDAIEYDTVTATNLRDLYDMPLAQVHHFNSNTQ